MQSRFNHDEGAYEHPFEHATQSPTSSLRDTQWTLHEALVLVTLI